MTFRPTFWTAALATVMLSSPAATAQFYNSGGCASCGTAARVAPVSSYTASCAPVASCTPVYTACYQTVPVTTYRKEKETVRVPYYKTAYEDREVTYYEPVTRQRTVEVPTVSYQTVVESRTVHRDMGRWKTNYQPIAKCSPCQVDPRPGLLGWLNRTGYSFRSAFTPNYRTTRSYEPRMMACTVPVTRQVAVRGTRKVVVNETQMVAKRKTERVEVRKLAWREETRTVNRPVTAYRTVPIGSALAFGYGGYGYPSTSVAFVDDGDNRTAEGPVPDDNFSEPRRSASETFREDEKRSTERTFERSGTDTDNRFQRSSFEEELSPPVETQGLQKPPRVFPDEQGNEAAPNFQDFSTQRSRRSQAVPTAYSSAGKSNGGRLAAGGWKASRKSKSADISVSSRNSATPAVSVTKN